MSRKSYTEFPCRIIGVSEQRRLIFCFERELGLGVYRTAKVVPFGVYPDGSFRQYSRKNFCDLSIFYASYCVVGSWAEYEEIEIDKSYQPVFQESDLLYKSGKLTVYGDNGIRFTMDRIACVEVFRDDEFECVLKIWQNPLPENKKSDTINY